MLLTLTDMAHGGAALGRDADRRVIFVPYALPGETVEVAIHDDRGRFAHAELLRVVEASPDRVEPVCRHFGVCGGCHWQHIAYPRQLALKAAVVRDQLARIGGLPDAPVRPTWPNPEPTRYSTVLSLSPTEEGGVGLWAPREARVLPVEVCHLAREPLEALLGELDIALPDLRRLHLRLGDDGALLAALEVEGVEPPEIELDFPLSLAILLPDGTAANLIGDNYTVQSLKGRDFRVSAGAFFYPSPAAADRLVDAVLEMAGLDAGHAGQVLEVYAGVGALTAFLAARAEAVVAVEANADAVDDLALNLADLDNISVYLGEAEAIVPALTLAPDVVVVDPPAQGLSREVLQGVLALRPERLVYVSGDVATLARDARHLRDGGYALRDLLPLDMAPQTFQVLTVSLWTPIAAPLPSTP